jgi:TRAP-type C4-dicarboxylate transport system permease small subunit
MFLVDRIVAAVDAVARGLAILLVIVITASMALQVFFRYVLNSSLSWSEEVSIWALVWLVFIGSVVLMREWEHINIPTFVNLLPLRFRPYVIIVAKGLTLLFLAVVAVLGYEMVSKGYHADAPVLHLSTRWAKLSIPLGATLMLVLGANQGGPGSESLS